MARATFEWDEKKDQVNRSKHGVSFLEAQQAFLDSQRIIADDLEHGHMEERYYCFGKVGDGIMTVRFTYRSHKIRIIGAGYWRRGRKIYEQEQNKIHR
ncbi:MAG: BrnT family toxin [Gammaproteobacteria bacterium]|nr:BrnT family toxin [Gammaproteobacteria bacterium]